MRIRSPLLVLVAFAFCVLTSLASATTPVVTQIKHHRDFRGPNNVAIATGDRLVMGANSVLPSSGTTGTAVQGATTRTLTVDQLSTKPDAIDRSIGYAPALTGSWSLTFVNDGDTTVVATPTVGAAEAIPLAEGLTSSGPVDTTPAFTWTTPPAAAPDEVQIRLFDRDHFVPIGRPDQIHLENIAGSATSYTVPAVLSTGQSLQPGGRYTIAVGLARLRPADDTTLTRSRTFLDFQIEAASVPALSAPFAALLALSLASASWYRALRRSR
jgi:hypothetical protein